jgi:hypothetical protein
MDRRERAPLSLTPQTTDGLAASPPHVRHVTREDLGARWPLTVAEADVGCDGSARAPRLFVLVAGTKYGLNANADAQGGYAALGEGRIGGRPLWKDAPPAPARKTATPKKIPTEALQEAASQECHP